MTIVSNISQQSQNDKLEREIGSLQGRITSLKRHRAEPVQTASNLNLPTPDACLDREASSRSLHAVTSREIKKKQLQVIFIGLLI